MTVKELATLAADEITQRNFSDVFDMLMQEKIIDASDEDALTRARTGIKDAFEADAKYRKLIEESF